MDDWIPVILPFVLLLARVSAFLAVAPLFGWRVIPTPVLVGLALWLSIFLGLHTPAAPAALSAGWLAATVMIVQQALVGLGLGLTTRLVFLAVQQGGFIIAQQMGLADAGAIDPISGDESQAVASLMEMIFAVFFLAAGGHHLLVALLGRSFQALPMSAGFDPAGMAQALVSAGSTMLLFGLKLAAPMLAAFLILAVVLAILSRVLPEMNILFESFPLRVGLGLFMAAAMMPLLNNVAAEVGHWMQRIIA